MGRNHKIIKPFILFIFSLMFLAFLSLFNISGVNAGGENYKVKPYLIVPFNWRARITAEKETEYKRNILDSLATAQNFYKDKLSGHTFEYLSEIETINAPNSYVDEDSNDIFGDLFRLKMKEFPILVNSVPGNYIYILYFIGSRDKTSGASCSVPCYETPNKEPNLVLISHDILDSLGSDASILYTTKRNFAKGVVTHELGHSFGLVFSGWSYTHPCSIISKNECKQEAVIGGKYPSESEYSRDIMGTGYQFFPDSTLNNTIYNPEVQKIFQSLFINPNNDPAPSSLGSKPTVLSGKVDSFSPNPISSGDILTITGRGLGSHEPGFFPGGWRAVGNVSGGNLDISVISWRDNEVKLIVKSSFEYPTKWIIYLLKTDEEKIELPEPLTVQGTKVSISPSPTPFLSSTSTPNPSPTTSGLQIIGEGVCKQIFSGSVCGTNQCPAGYQPTNSMCSATQLCCALSLSPTSVFPQVLSLYPNPITVGALTIGGTGFGNDKGVITFSSPSGTFSTLSDYFEVRKWTDNEIVIYIAKPLTNKTESWVLSIDTTSGKRVNTTLTINAIPTPPPPSPSPGASFNPTTSPTPLGSPVVSATPIPTLSPSNITQIKVSNYRDFRDNMSGDDGSATSIFANQSQNPIVWKKSTFSPNSPIYIVLINSDGTNGAIQAVDLQNGQIYQVPNSPFTIQAKVIKKIIKIKFGDKEITSDFTQKIRLRLPGIVGQSNSFPVPIVITYSDGTFKSLFFSFNYNPQSIATPTPTPSSVGCIGSGVPFSVHNDNKEEWGSSCINGTDKGRATAVPGTCGCTVAQCLQYNNGHYCWVNNGQVFNDPIGCAGKGAALPASCFSGAAAAPPPTPTPATPTPTVTSCDTSIRSGPGWQWNYICGCVSVDNGISEPGHYATCSVNPQQDTHCYSNVSNPVTECPAQ